ncbi:MAG TPA: glycosyltransferase family 4 protein [Lacipirellulaceae bacterium]|nr:glycosyltransferase family 4 protein [Lacipirellulaceae bacterium]
MDQLRVLVMQNGARHNYAVPRVLAEAGALEAFYTDACGNVGLGSLASLGRHLPWVGGRMNRLAHRSPPRAVRERTSTFLGSASIDGFAKRCFGDRWGSRCLDYQMKCSGLKQANLIYSSLGWGRDLLGKARRRGVPVVTEFYVRPSLWKTYQAEFRAFPGWEETLPLTGLENAIGTLRDPCTTADFLLAPNDSVADDIASSHGFARDRIMVVPYGVDDVFFQLRNTPIKGCVLFAGTCCLGKGIHYLAFAAEQLAARGLHYDFRIAGNVSERIRAQPAAKYLSFLGRIPRSQFWREYESADLVVVPSLSEGFSTVGLEALAAGVPVVATDVAGTVVRHGVDGLLVPERDSNALAEAISKIVEDRPLRERMSIASREGAKEFTWHKYGERLLAALNEMSYQWHLQAAGSSCPR